VFFANGSGRPTVPTPSPVSPTAPPAGGFCFSGDTEVTVKGKGPTPIVDLMVGDHILASGGQYELVYAFGHRDPTRSASFLQFMLSELELSEDHMLFIQGRGFVPANMVKVGDQFDTGAVVEAVLFARVSMHRSLPLVHCWQTTSSILLMWPFRDPTN
jgi:hypothetical protein